MNFINLVKILGHRIGRLIQKVFKFLTIVNFMKLMPQEIEVWYILPAIRRELTIVLKGKGMLQKDIATLLGITESAVSQYLHEKRAHGGTFNHALLQNIKESAHRITQNPHRSAAEIQSILKESLNQDLLCRIHRQYDSEVPKSCEVCFRP